MTATPAYQVYVLSYYPESKKEKQNIKTLSIRNPRRTRSLRFFESLYIYLYSSLKQTDKNTIYKFS